MQDYTTLKLSMMKLMINSVLHTNRSRDRGKVWNVVNLLFVGELDKCTGMVCDRFDKLYDALCNQIMSYSNSMYSFFSFLCKDHICYANNIEEHGCPHRIHKLLLPINLAIFSLP